MAAAACGRRHASNLFLYKTVLGNARIQMAVVEDRVNPTSMQLRISMQLNIWGCHATLYNTNNYNALPSTVYIVNEGLGAFTLHHRYKTS